MPGSSGAFTVLLRDATLSADFTDQMQTRMQI